jgi:hypothetical protein
MEGTEAPAVSTNLNVSDIQLGTAVDSNRKITMPKTEFTPTDTIYASVLTDGAPPSATLTALWTYEKDDKSAQVDSTTITITPTGPTATEFHISRPSGLPTGKYHVQIWADGQSAGSRDFDVK